MKNDIDRKGGTEKTYSYPTVVDGTSVSVLSEAIILKAKPKYNLVTVDIESANRPLSGEISRSSLNMQALPYRDNYKISVNYVTDHEDDDLPPEGIRFNIKHDSQLGSDVYVAKDLRHGSILTHPLEYVNKLYIADPMYASGHFQVTIECFDN